MLAALLPVLGPLLDRALGAVLPDPDARAKAITAVFGELSKADLAQLEVNKAEAQNPNLFVSGWRPAIGWICAAALAYSYIIVPLGLWVAQVKGLSIPKPPVLDNNLWELMFGLLGLGAMRTYEKVQKLTR